MTEPEKTHHEKMRDHLRKVTKAHARLARASQEAAQANLDRVPVVAPDSSTPSAPTREESSTP